MSDRKALTRKDFISGQDVRWCPSCGDYAILSVVQGLLPEIGVDKEKIVFVSGIGCSSRFPFYVNTFGFHTLHGRAPTVATGIKLANPELDLWLVTGDGDGFSIGGNHMIHLLRRNPGIKVLLLNNRIYGLTKGQYSPTSPAGLKTKSSPGGSLDHPVNPCSLALGAEATFIARSTDKDLKHLAATLRVAAAHKGTSFVEILQNCVIYNDGTWDEVYAKEKREEAQLLVEHGKPLRFGKDKAKGIRQKGFGFEIVVLGENGVTEGDLVVHDQSINDPAYHVLLSRLGCDSEGPMAMGVLRQVARAPYEVQLDASIAEAKAKRPNAGLADLYRDFGKAPMWTV
ncbi:MAG: 2-oxoacid:ferredoxin oxidoreductase subunit beta [Planctomycetes bacterium]|nr:2-oxoacid:ferredoxin oxidoreductase subunit beta [Planctomycetota bacterium]